MKACSSGHGRRVRPGRPGGVEGRNKYFPWLKKYSASADAMAVRASLTSAAAFAAFARAQALKQDGTAIASTMMITTGIMNSVGLWNPLCPRQASRRPCTVVRGPSSLIARPYQLPFWCLTILYSAKNPTHRGVFGTRRFDVADVLECSMKRLIVTADDFGLTPGVVTGIVEAHERGIVTATSLMVNAEAAESAFAWARDHRSLAVGLHFVLTFARPAGPREPLGALIDDEGRFRRLESGAHERATPQQVRSELRAQLERFEKGVGRAPTHMDGHHHVHAFPGILTAVLEEAVRLGVPVRAPDDATRERIRRASVETTDHFLASFYGADNVSEDQLLEILNGAPDGTSELMCHPAKQDDRLQALSSYVGPRWTELATLTSPRVVAATTHFAT